jgi:hypothetical protein
VAERLGFTVRIYLADWESFGKRAGPIRNKTMLDQEHRPEEPIDKALAFHKDPGLGKGTKDMAARLIEAGIPVETFAA